jgi:DNA-binding transcriptional regulator/RsmH inhibitor MraZ
MQDLAPFTAAIGTMPPAESDSSEAWVEVARLLATVWRIAIHVEPNQIRFTVPEQIRRAEQLPPSGGTVVVFALGNILEIWDALKWHDHVRGAAKRKEVAISEAIEDLGQR